MGVEQAGDGGTSNDGRRCLGRLQAIRECCLHTREVPVQPSKRMYDGTVAGEVPLLSRPRAGGGGEEEEVGGRL